LKRYCEQEPVPTHYGRRIAPSFHKRAADTIGPSPDYSGDEAIQWRRLSERSDGAEIPLPDADQARETVGLLAEVEDSYRIGVVESRRGLGLAMKAFDDQRARSARRE
jgi:hypothetical protein